MRMSGRRWWAQLYQHWTRLSPKCCSGLIAHGTLTSHFSGKQPPTSTEVPTGVYYRAGSNNRHTPFSVRPVNFWSTVLFSTPLEYKYSTLENYSTGSA